MKHKNVSACCVVGQFDEEHQMGQVPIAFIVLKEYNETTITEVKQLCEQGQSANYLPHSYKVLETLPLTPNGKVDYRALEKLAFLN